MSGSVIIPLQAILEHANPLETPPWPDLIVEVDAVMMRRAYLDLLSRRVDPDRHAAPLTEHDFRDGRCHAGRVAWLAVNGWSDPISIEASDITEGLWPIADGNHRLAAAALLGRAEIEADIGGFEEDIILHFGGDVARRIFDEDVEMLPT